MMKNIEKEVWEYVANPEIQQTIEKAVKKNVKYDFEDVFQDTVLKLFEKLCKNGKLDKCKTSSGYLYSMAVGTSINIMIKKRKIEEKELPTHFDWEVA